MTGAALSSRLRVLVLARAFPNTALPGQGIWVARLVQATLPIADPVVVAPVPRVLPAVPVPEWRRLAEVPRRAKYGDVAVLHPRVLGGLVHHTHRFDANLAFRSVLAVARRLHAQHPIDLIHAHFIYPDGVVASRVGGELGVPVVTTEHAFWRPWLDDEPQVRRQVIAALPGIAVVTAVSESTRRTIMSVAGRAVRVDLLPNVLDETVFAAPSYGPRVPGRVLFVGMVRHVKGLDVLVRAMADLVGRIPDAHLRVVGSTLTPAHRRDEESLRRLVVSLGLGDRIEFAGLLTPHDVCREMSRASVLAVPSRRESFSSVTIESLACGTPVVATRCGGPEEVVDDSTGRLVAVDDPAALADALAQVLCSTRDYDPARLRAGVLPRFGLGQATARIGALYTAALHGRKPAAQASGSPR